MSEICRRVVQYFQPAVLPSEKPSFFTGETMLAVLGKVRSVLEKPVRSVLVLGETGTGKEIVAQMVRWLCPTKPFIAINCACFNEELLLSELFGHRKGAFTGATDNHAGVFERAHGGFIFLDELGSLRPKAQAAFLRVLETGEIRRLSDGKVIQVDVKFLCATNENLNRAMEQGDFRRDLYHRISQCVISLPPLRKRTFAERSALVQHVADELGLCLTKEAAIFVREHPWRFGNIREMRNAILHAFGQSPDNQIYLHHLPPDVIDAEFLFAEKEPKPSVSQDQSWEELKNVMFATYIESMQRMESAPLTVSQIARSLKISDYKCRQQLRKIAKMDTIKQ